MMPNSAGLDGIMSEVNKYKKQLEGSVSTLTKQFESITKKFNFVKEKKTKLNKMPATMMLTVDKSVLIVFDNPEDGEKFYGK